MSDLASALQRGIFQRLQQRLASLVPVEAPLAAESKLAAVAVLVRLAGAEPPSDSRITPLFGDAELLFIKRAVLARDPWSGHVAFPGGRYEVGDESLVHTAFRETREELSIDVWQSGVLLGQLDDIAPRSPSLPPVIVRPFVAVVPSALAMHPNNEVADAFWVPVSRLRAAAARMEHSLMVNGAEVRFPAYGVSASDARLQVVWGLTERIVSQLLPLFDAEPD